MKHGKNIWIKPIRLFTILLCVASFVQVSPAQCRRANRDEVPHGANMFEQMPNQTVPNIRGRVFFPDGELAKDIVVEIFRYTGSNSYADIQKALQQNRIAACVTRNGGTFSFKGLQSGTYLLRAGTSYIHGMNECHIIVMLKPGVRGNKGDGLEIRLSLGT